MYLHLISDDNVNLCHFVDKNDQNIVRTTTNKYTKIANNWHDGKRKKMIFAKGKVLPQILCDIFHFRLMNEWIFRRAISLTLNVYVKSSSMNNEKHFFAADWYDLANCSTPYYLIPYSFAWNLARTQFASTIWNIYWYTMGLLWLPSNENGNVRIICCLTNHLRMWSSQSRKSMRRTSTTNNAMIIQCKRCWALLYFLWIDFSKLYPFKEIIADFPLLQIQVDYISRHFFFLKGQCHILEPIDPNLKVRVRLYMSFCFFIDIIFIL